MTSTATPQRFSAPGPASLDEGEEPTAMDARDRDLDLLCEQWVAWCRTRRLYGPAPISGTILGKLSGSTRAMAPVDARCSPLLSAFHIAYTCQPRDALDRQVFDFYYVHRVKPIKRAADALGVSRRHFYSLLAAFRIRVANAAEAIQADNQIANDAMLVRRAERVALGDSYKV